MKLLALKCCCLRLIKKIVAARRDGRDARFSLNWESRGCAYLKQRA